MKRIYCFLICFAIAFSGFGTFAADSGAAADNAEAVTASEKIEPLTQLGVLDVTEPNSTVLKKNIVYSLDKITGGSNGIACNSGYVGTSKDTINAHACEYCFGFFNRLLISSAIRRISICIIRGTAPPNRTARRRGA